MCMGEYTHAVLPPHSALLHILRLPSQFLKDEQTANCQLKDKLFSQPSQLFVAPQSFKCYYETAVMKISLTSINCRGEKKTKQTRGNSEDCLQRPAQPVSGQLNIVVPQ